MSVIVALNMLIRSAIGALTFFAPGAKRFCASDVSGFVSLGCQPLWLIHVVDCLSFGLGGKGGGVVPFMYFCGDASTCSDPIKRNALIIIQISIVFHFECVCVCIRTWIA